MPQIIDAIDGGWSVWRRSCRMGSCMMGERGAAQPLSGWRYKLSVGLVCVAALVAANAAAHAEMGDWPRFGPGHGSIDAPYDVSFARQWEANPPKGFPTLSPDNLNAMKAAIKRYSEVVEGGGWKAVPDAQLQPGINGPAVAILRERLSLSGDLKEAGGAFSEVYDQDVERAVKRFQASNGLTPTGIVDRRTLAALNVSAAARLRQLKTNYARLAEYARGTGKRYVMVNIPGQQIELVENDQVVSRHSGVVGKPDRPTPVLRSTIHELNFNPVWHLPPTVIEKDLIPKGQEMARRGQDVLEKYNIEAYGADGKKLNSTKVNWSNGAARGLTYRQQPGPENPLGFVKINFHNHYSVYMHDSPSQSLFGRNFRAASSGCVRVQGVEQVAAWLMQEQGWTQERVLAMKKSGERLDVRLKRPVPLYFVYITAWATEDGVIQFRRDLYNKDGVGPTASAY
jgi:murein L,D-transpeptidase YcbB/YkuD